MPAAQRIEGLGGKTQIAHLWEGLRTQITSLHSKCKLPGQSKRPKLGSEPNTVRVHYAVGRWGEGRTGPRGMGWGRSSSLKEQWRFLTSIRGKGCCIGKKNKSCWWSFNFKWRATWRISSSPFITFSSAPLLLQSTFRVESELLF